MGLVLSDLTARDPDFLLEILITPTMQTAEHPHYLIPSGLAVFSETFDQK